MHKGPLTAIIVSIIALFTIYLFTDIKEKPDQDKVQISEQSTEPESISSFLASLSKEEQEETNTLIIAAQENRDATAVEELISFFESKQQYNYAAYYHTLQAEISGEAKDWELAGDRQISVSSNEAYDADFNQILYDKGLESYRRALSIDSTNLEVQVKLGSAIVDRSAQPMEGISLLLGVIAVDSMHLNANLALGKFGIISGQYDKAVQRLEKVLSLQPENTEALFLIGEAYSGLGENEKAISALSKCKELVENEELKKEIDAYLQQLL